MALDGLNEELATNEHLQDIEDVNSLAQNYVELKTADPFSGLDKQTKEKLGDIKDVNTLASKYVDTASKVPVVPDSADAYQYQFSEDVPVDEVDHNLFRKEAHKLGLTQAQFEGLINFDVARISRALGDYESKRKEAVSKLVEEKKIAEADLNSKVEQVYKALGLEDMVKRLDLNSDPQFLKAMLEISEKVSQDVLVSVQTTSSKQIQRSEDGMPILDYPSMNK